MASRGYSLVVVLGLLIDGDFSCFGAWALDCGLSSCGKWAQLPHGMCGLPQTGIEPRPHASGVRSLSHRTTREVSPLNLKVTLLKDATSSFNPQPSSSNSELQTLERFQLCWF